MELCLVIPIIGLFIIALSIVFFLLAFTSTTCFRKLTNNNVFYLYCLILLVIGISVLMISVSPENEDSLIEKLKNVIYNIDDNYSPCKGKKDQDENNKDNKEFDNQNKSFDNKSNENETNIDNNDINKIYDNNLNDTNKTYDMNINDNYKKDDNSLNDSNKNYDYDFQDETIKNDKNQEEEIKNNEYKNDYNFIDKEIQVNKKDINRYIIRNVTFSPGHFLVYNFAKFWIKFANFLRVIGRKTFNYIRNKKE